MKTNFTKSVRILLAMLFSVAGVQAQDINFSQFYDVPVLRNPAIAGLFNGDMRFATGFRNQWQSVSVPYRTVVLSGEFKIGRAHV